MIGWNVFNLSASLREAAHGGHEPNKPDNQGRLVEIENAGLTMGDS